MPYCLLVWRPDLPAHPRWVAAWIASARARPLCKTVLDVVKVASVATGREGPLNRFEGWWVASEMAFIHGHYAALACSFIVPQNPRLRFGWGSGWCGHGSLSRLIVATPVVTRAVRLAKLFSCTLSDQFCLPETGYVAGVITALRD